jgi:hypothetical protein
MGHPQDHLFGGLGGIEEHGEESLCYGELEEFYGYALGGVANGD